MATHHLCALSRTVYSAPSRSPELDDHPKLSISHPEASSEYWSPCEELHEVTSQEESTPSTVLGMMFQDFERSSADKNPLTELCEQLPKMTCSNLAFETVFLGEAVLLTVDTSEVVDWTSWSTRTCKLVTAFGESQRGSNQNYSIVFSLEEFYRYEDLGSILRRLEQNSSIIRYNLVLQGK